MSNVIQSGSGEESRSFRLQVPVSDRDTCKCYGFSWWLDPVGKKFA